MRIASLLLVLSAIASVFAGTQALAAPAPLPRYGVFIYSDLCVGRESGDPSGFRVTLIREGDGDRVEFEWTEGPLYGGLGYGVKLDDRTSRLTFSVNTNVGGGPEEFEDYSAEVSDAELVLHSSRGLPNGATEHVYRLPRVRDLARKIGPCAQR